MEKTNGGNLIQIKNLVATVNLNNGDTLVTVNKANMELKRGNSYSRYSVYAGKYKLFIMQNPSY